MEPKSGKTSTAVKFPKHLLLAFERGFNALNNVMAQNINKWSEFKTILKQLKDPKVQEKFETVIIDTCDIAWDLCEKHICQREGVDKIGDIPFGGGYAATKKEFDETLRSIPLMGFGLVMISHSKNKQFSDEKGTAFDKTIMTLPDNPRLIVSRMSDIIGYSKAVETEDGETETRLYLRGTTRFEAGSRFKFTPDYIVFNYNNLVNVIADAIKAQEKEDGVSATNEHVNVYKATSTYSFDDVIQEAQTVISTIMSKGEESAPKISKVIEQHLGKGKKLNQVTEDQVDIVALILSDLKDLLNELE